MLRPLELYPLPKHPLPFNTRFLNHRASVLKAMDAKDTRGSTRSSSIPFQHHPQPQKHFSTELSHQTKSSELSNSLQIAFDGLFDRIYRPVLLVCTLLLCAIVLLLGYIAWPFPKDGLPVQLDEKPGCNPECPRGSSVSQLRMPVCTWTCLSHSSTAIDLLPSAIAGIFIITATYVGYTVMRATAIRSGDMI